MLLLADVEVRDRGAGRRTDCLGAHIVSALCRELGGARGFGAHHLIDGNMMIAAIVEGVRDRGHDQPGEAQRSEEHTSELQSLMRISYAVFCLKKKNIRHKPCRYT